MLVNLKYGRGLVPTFIPGKNLEAVLEPAAVPCSNDSMVSIGQALETPVGTCPVEQLVRPGQKVIIIVSDATRPCPTHLLLPPLLYKLSRGGIKDTYIKILFATGTHRPSTPEEKERLLGKEIAGRLACIDHRCNDDEAMVLIGRSSYGNPITINKEVMEADVRIAIANIDLHVFAGYSGGSKTVMPGAAGLETIMKNHEMIYGFPGETRAGLLENPIRKEIDEGGRMAGLDFILNVVLDDGGQIIHVAAGHPESAFLEGVKVCDSVYKRPLVNRGDIVLASAGGYPKDINFYQAQKALDYASLAVKDGGTIILLAECSEGIGSDSLSGFLQNAASWDLVVDRGRQKKSYHPYGLRGLVGRGIEVFLVSEIPQELIETTPLRPFHQIGTALDVALEKHGSVAGIVLMPYAGSTLPCG